MRLSRPLRRWTLIAAAAIVGAPLLATAARADSIPDRRHRLQHELADTKERIADARQREQSLAETIEATSDRIAGVEAELSRLSADLAGLERRLAEAQSRLRELEYRVRERTRQLRRARKELAVARQRLDRRLIDIYTAGETDPLAVLLGAESLADLVDRLEAREAVLAQDTWLVGQVTELRSRIAGERRRARALRAQQVAETAALARETAERRAVVTRVAAQRQALTALRARRNRSLASVQVQRHEWEQEAAALEVESARIASIIAGAPPAPAPGEPSPSGGPAPSATPPSSSGFVWPVRGPIVSPFGQRWGRLHAGVDIAAPAGTPIVASAAGRVIYSGSMSGYGNIVVIQHAGGIATAYAHNSANYVSVGQTVSQGQRIAAVGCTGSCFGDHVHFEVRVNGSPVDPMRYI